MNTKNYQSRNTYNTLLLIQKLQVKLYQSYFIINTKTIRAVIPVIHYYEYKKLPEP